MVIKVALDDAGPDTEAATLASAAGRGYALLYDYDPARRALLLESLGRPLSDAGTTPERQLAVLADTVSLAWQDPAACGRPEGPKAATLATLIETWFAGLDRPCPPAVVDQALRYADRLRSVPAGELVVVHGDPHPGNLLRVPAPRPGAETGYCFVDPDGIVTDRAYDLGVILRDWTSHLTGSDPRAVLAGYCRQLAGRTGVAADRIWAWGFLERVSTGLYLKSLAADSLADRFLRTAAALV